MFNIVRCMIVGIAAFVFQFGAAAEPAAPKSLESEVSFKSSVDGISFQGTLAKPAGISRGFVLLLAGSGKVDRDETTPAKLTASGKQEKLFAQISRTLTEAGFTTFRYDKRGVLDSDGKVDAEIWKTADRVHLISDATDAAKFFANKQRSPVEKVILLGHSEGTIIATEVAIALGGKVSALLLLGAQARSMKEMLHFQIVESRSKRSAGSGVQEAPEVEYQKALEMIATTKDSLAPDGKPVEWYRQHLAAPSNAERMKLVKGPKFVFQGTDDPQTPVDEIVRLQKAGIADLQVFRYPGLGHGFSPDRDGKPTLGPIDSKVLHDLATTVGKLR